MTWQELHKESENLAIAAHEKLRAGDYQGAYQDFLAAAALESSALGNLDGARPRTFGITAVSAAALWYKGRDLDAAEAAAYNALSRDFVPEFARDDLRTILQSIWNERAQIEAGIKFEADQVVISIKGGDVVRGGAPLDLILEKAHSIQSFFYRTVEFLEGTPLRKKGPPAKTLQDHHKPWVFQSVPGSYQFAVAIRKPDQIELFGEKQPEPRDLISNFLNILRASSESPSDGLPVLVESSEYRDVFLKLTRNLAPTGKSFQQMEVRGAMDATSILLSPESRNLISNSLRQERKPESISTDSEEEIHGVLRALSLDQDWLEVSAQAKSIRVIGVGDAVDDLIGPMVNHEVVVRVSRDSKGKLKFIDIEQKE